MYPTFSQNNTIIFHQIIVDCYHSGCGRGVCLNFIVFLMSVGVKIFLSIYDTKIDEKKRVSVPANFRSIIEGQGDNIIYAYPSLTNECLEVCTLERINELEKHIETFDIFSEERDVLSTSILGACEPLQIDAKGRIYISERLLNFAQIDKSIVFMGKGKVFEIWNKEKFDNYFNNARNVARANSLFSINRKNSEATK